MRNGSHSRSTRGQARRRRIGVCAAVGLFVGAVVYAYLVWLADSPVQPAKPAQQAVLDAEIARDAAIARIDAESNGVLSVAVSSPPRSAEAQRGTSPDAAYDSATEELAPSPPEGYSFVTVDGEMATTPMPESDTSPRESIDDGLDWLDEPDAVSTLVRQAAAAGRDWSFGWVRAAHDAGPEASRAALEEFGVEVLGASGRLLRAKLPGDKASLRAISDLPEVAGLGAVPKERKVATGFVEEMQTAPVHERTPVFITLMTDDPQGRWRHRLEELGAVVGRFDPDVRAYAAHIANTALDAIASQDFVLAIEPIGIVRAAHDTAVPAMGADALRRHEGSPGLFSGTAGASVPIAVMDTGLNINHLDIATNRESICGANFVYNQPRVDEADLWVDDGLHGTHVTGTIAGNGYAELRYAGMAPGVRHIRFAKVLSHFGSGASDSIQRGMDFLAQPSSCAEAGWSSVRVKPLIVNMSLSASNRSFEGRGIGARKLDAVVWGHRQLYVVAQSNSGISGFSNYGTAKNSLAVGAVLDSGDIASFSSHGPTADGRLAPQIVATGVAIWSTQGGGNRGNYLRLSGTSMAAPSVAGVAALLMDAVQAHREYPALTRARLMASAIKPDAWLHSPNRFPADNSNGPGALQVQYGLGKVSARTSVLNRNQADGWVSGSAVSKLNNGEYAHRDIEVPENTSRLDLVMTWDEPPTDTIGQAVLNDLDLWLDRDGDCGSAACGERSSTSRKDNVEWIILRDPPPGTYRVKILPRRIHGAAPRAALAWTLIRGPATPQLGIQANKSNLDGTGPHNLTLTLTADGYVAAGTRLHVDCDAGDPGDCNRVRISKFNETREDGIVNATATPNQIASWGTSFALGEIAVGERQEVRFQVANQVRGPVRLYFTASAWNAEAAFASIGVKGSDGAVPPAVAKPPANDGFGAAALLEGENGALALDLRRATTEPGEPAFDAFVGRPAGSLWHVWTAPADGLARFGVQIGEAYSSQSAVKIDIFQGDHIARLEPVASKLGGASFFADQGETYRIRVSHAGTGLPLTLHWSQGPRPANDDFSQAVTLTGAEGAVKGSNQGATLEPGELFGSLAATTWHRWTAPTSGDWRFRSDDSGSRVLAFTGSTVADLRLVSGYPNWSVHFPARAGEVYRIAIAAGDAFAGGRRYRLTWREDSRDGGNDDFANAEEISGASSSINISLGSEETVEPGEPAETGVRTRWWTWTVPEDGRYTWRLTDTLFTELQVTAFAGPVGGQDVDFADLQLVGATGPHVAATEFAFNAVAKRRYWFAAGHSASDLGAFQWFSASATLAWGAAPENDQLANAAALSGASGAVGGTNAFATTERGERTGREGNSSLWWTWEAPTAGWYRFRMGNEALATLAAYQDGGDGFGGLDPIASSQVGWLNAGGRPAEVLFHAEPGVRYWLRLGSPSEGEFRLQWEEAAAPVWLNYAGRLGRSQLGLERWGDLGGLAFDDLGTTLYMQSDLGLHVLERDAATGALKPVRVIENSLAASSALVWDSRRTKLYARDCNSWRQFTPVGENRRELSSDSLPGTGSLPGACDAKMFMDATGEFLFSATSAGIEVFTFDSSDSLLSVGASEGQGGLRDTVISKNGGSLYAITDSQLQVYARGTATGGLIQMATLDYLGLLDAQTLAISNNDGHLFVFNSNGDTALLRPGGADNWQILGTLPKFGNAPWFSRDGNCGFSAGRNGTSAAEAFCTNSAFSVEHPPAAEESSGSIPIAAADYLAHWQPDRFNNHVPEFTPKSMAASPDGKHIYVATDGGEILHFERVGNQIVNTAPPVEEPDLVVGFPRTDSGGDAAGTSFTLRTVVRNQGDIEAAATTLRWHRSPDAIISAEDEGVGTTSLAALAASASGDKSVTLPVPSSTDIHYYGACVDALPNETRTGNNCSAGALFTVDMSGNDGDGGDDHGNSLETATEVAVPSSTAGRLESPGDLDYFRIVLQQAATVELHTTGSTDTYGTLYRPNGSSITEDDDGGNGVNFRINRHLAAGTYFVEVRGFASATGGYLLEVAFSDNG